MNCEDYKNLIFDLVENKLDTPTAEHVTAHLVSCETCETEFETLFDGKEIYADFFCEIEPPSDLSANFRAKLEIEDSRLTATAKPTFGVYQRLSKSLAFFRLNPAMTTAAIFVLLALGFVSFNFTGNWRFAEDARLSPVILENLSLISPQEKQTETKTETPVSVSDKTKKSAVAGLKKGFKKEAPKLIALKQTTTKKPERKRVVPAEIIKLSTEEQNQIAQIQGLEIDAERQIEKVELLFRTFRNARSIENTGQYDVSYEKQQARKLLQANVKLKQRAESYGTLLTEETLNKIEPYLLDIANLDSNPSVEQVAKIKNRFRNQSIITDLQGF